MGTRPAAVETVRQKGRLKKKLRRKLLAKLGPIAEGDRVVVVCVGDDCAPREENRATFAEAKMGEAAAHDPHVRVHGYGCLKVCRKGTVVAVLPEGTLYRRVSPTDVGDLVAHAGRGPRAANALARRAAADPDASDDGVSARGGP